jgi:hypothetical protein
MIEASVGLILAVALAVLGLLVLGLGLLVLAELLVQKTGRVGPWSVGHGAVGVRAEMQELRWSGS